MKDCLLLRSLSILCKRNAACKLSPLKVMYCVSEVDITLFFRMVVLGRLNELAKEWIIDVSLAKVRALVVYYNGVCPSLHLK